MSPRARTRTCVDCGGEFWTKGGRTTRCPSCYPAYRQAYNLTAAAAYRSKLHGLPFDLTVEWVHRRLLLPCPRTGLPFAIQAGGHNMSDRHPMGPSIDKINPAAGYTRDNSQVVSWWYNCAKQRFTDEEVLELCLNVVRMGGVSSFNTSLVPLAVHGTILGATQMGTRGALAAVTEKSGAEK